MRAIGQQPQGAPDLPQSVKDEFDALLEVQPLRRTHFRAEIGLQRIAATLNDRIGECSRTCQGALEKKDV